jgi:hypothetical protein
MICRVFFIGHSVEYCPRQSPALNDHVYRELDSRYRDCRVPTTRRKATLGKRPSAAVYTWRPLSLPSAGRQHSAKHLLCRVFYVQHSANWALPSSTRGHSAKFIFNFFSFPTQTFYDMFLHYQTYMFHSCTIIKVFPTTIRFCLFNCIFLDNSDLNCKSLEKCKTVNVKMVFMLFNTSYSRLKEQIRIFEHHAH